MLDPNLLRNKLNLVAKKLIHKGFKLDINKLTSLEELRKKLQIKTENLQAKRNFNSKLIGIAAARHENVEPLLLEVNELSKELNKVKSELTKIKSEIHDISLNIPNLPDKSVPIGENEKFNVELKKWGSPKEFNFQVRDHVTLGEIHGGLDFASATKIAGSRFVVIKGQIARLHRALIQFMLDLHTEQHSYTETHVPYLANYNTLYGTGQLPKFTNDLFHISSLEKSLRINNYALIPTAEVPLTNLVRNEILDEEKLPIKLVASTPCFRSEAGSYGRDTRGLVRMHQFDKVEIVQITNPINSMDTLEIMTRHAERVLELLELPYRRMLVCTGDMGFSSNKTYDLEVWIPAQIKYREVSSCSNMWDFQARRIQARYRSKHDKKTRLVHTLNGSGLAIERTLIAVLENYQQKDGSIKIPRILSSYMGGKQYI